jgi:hypothetical protein
VGLEAPSHLNFIQRLALEGDESAAFTSDSRPGPHSSAQPVINVDPAQPSLGLPRNLNSFHGTPPSLSAQTPGPQDDLVLPEDGGSETWITDSAHGTSSEHTPSRRSSSFMDYNASTSAPGNIMNVRAYRKSTLLAKNAFVVTGIVLYRRLTGKNIIKGFLWSLAISSMHYVGILALRIPEGYFTVDPILILLSAAISWIVCLVGCILMTQMETHLAQQFLFSAVATGGVAAMHITGMLLPYDKSLKPESSYRNASCDLLVSSITI